MYIFIKIFKRDSRHKEWGMKIVLKIKRSRQSYFYLQWFYILLQKMVSSKLSSKNSRRCSKKYTKSKCVCFNEAIYDNENEAEYEK